MCTHGQAPELQGTGVYSFLLVGAVPFAEREAEAHKGEMDRILCLERKRSRPEGSTEVFSTLREAWGPR